MNERHHFLDACRALLMFLGIPYHAALVYSAKISWLVDSPEGSTLFDYLALTTHAFRMPAFFVVAGFFSMLLIARKGPATWLGARFERIGVPFLAALAISTPIQIIAIQYAAAGRSNVEVGYADITAWLTAWLSEPQTDKVFHLWFLPELIVLSSVFALLFVTGIWTRGNRLLDRTASLPVALLVAPLLGVWGLYAYGVYASSRVLGSSLFVFGVLDLQSLLRHLPFFLFGALLAARPAFFDRFTRPSWLAWICGLVILALWVAIGPEPGRGTNLLRILVGPAAAILMTHVILSGTRLLINRPNALVRLGTESAFTVYLVHQPVIMVLAILLMSVHWTPEVEFLLVVAATTLIALGFHLVVRRSGVLSYLFNGIRQISPHPKDRYEMQQEPLASRR